MKIKAVLWEGCNSTNGFKHGQVYEARAAGHNDEHYEVTLPNGARRFIGSDLSGGAHLQRVGQWSSETRGHFELVQSYQQKLGRALDKYPELGMNVFISEATIDSILEEEG